MINALKSILVVELPTHLMKKDMAQLYLIQVKEYITEQFHGLNNDDSLVILVFPSNKINVQLLNSPYDLYEKYNNLDEKFSDIEEFINLVYNKKEL